MFPSVDDPTLGVDSTSTRFHTRILAGLVRSAELAHFAVLIFVTFVCLTSLARFSSESIGTETHSSVLRDLAESVNSARRCAAVAWVPALLVATRLVIWTV